jgi:diacylglycerol kinase (ATP)
MRVFVLFNPNAGTAHLAAAVRERLAARPGFTVREPRSPDHTRELAAGALRDGYDLIVAAGGDGTVHAVVNGLAPDFGRSRLAVLPLGTGNDLRRTLAVPDDPEAALALLDHGSERLLDLIEVKTSGGTTYCINVAAGGFSGQMQEALTDDLKKTWGPLAYLRGAAAVLPDLTGYQTYLQCDDGPPERVEALNVVVANGRFAAKGWEVASKADPADGLLDVVVVRYAPLLDLAAVGARLLGGDYLESDQVMHRRAARVRVESRPGMWFSVDGELLTNEPVTFTVRHQALRVLVGPGFDASRQGREKEAERLPSKSS